MLGSARALCPRAEHGVLPAAGARGRAPDGSRRLGPGPTKPLPVGRRRRRRRGGVACRLAPLACDTPSRRPRRPPPPAADERDLALRRARRRLPRDRRARCALPMRALELGASAGLNLHFDRYRYEGGGLAAGRPTRRCASSTTGAAGRRRSTPRSSVAERRGCDLDPIDAATEDGRLALLSYVMPDELDRIEMMRGALSIAGAVPGRRRSRASADTWIAAPAPQPAGGDGDRRLPLDLLDLPAARGDRPDRRGDRGGRRAGDRRGAALLAPLRGERRARWASSSCG